MTSKNLEREHPDYIKVYGLGTYMMGLIGQTLADQIMGVFKNTQKAFLLALLMILY